MILQFGADPGTEHPVVVDQENADLAHGLLPLRLWSAVRGTAMRTSVPAPWRLEISTVPPARSVRPTMDSAIPPCPLPTAAGSNPRPSSVTNAVTSSGSISTYTDTLSAPAW